MIMTLLKSLRQCIHDQIICQIICQMLFAQRFDQIFDELFDEKFEANLTEFAQMLQYLQCCIWYLKKIMIISVFKRLKDDVN